MRLDSSTIQRGLSLLILLAYIIYEYHYTPPFIGSRLHYPEYILAIATGMIWWPTQKGFASIPPRLLRGIGWFILLTVPTILFLIRRAG